MSPSVATETSERTASSGWSESTSCGVTVKVTGLWVWGQRDRTCAGSPMTAGNIKASSAHQV